MRRATTSLRSALPAMRAGFTLLELIVVLLVMGILVSLAVVRTEGWRRRKTLAYQGEMALSQALRARQLAVAEGWPARLRMDLDALRITVETLGPAGAAAPDDGLPPTLDLVEGPLKLGLSFSPAGNTSPEQTTGVVDILFFPDARCDQAGTLTLATPERSTRVVFDAGVRLPRWEGRP